MTAPVVPPPVHCPVCGAAYEADGSHISAVTGAHIPAMPEEAGR